MVSKVWVKVAKHALHTADGSYTTCGKPDAQEEGEGRGGGGEGGGGGRGGKRGGDEWHKQDRCLGAKDWVA